jgi:hypothetical protein
VIRVTLDLTDDEKARLIVLLKRAITATVSAGASP